MIHFVGDYDVIVAGGGTAGVVAAVAAARNGARTLLVEKNGFLGGVPTAAMVSCFLSFHNMRGERVAGGIPQEIVDRLLDKGGAIPPGHLYSPYGNTYSVTPFDAETLKLVYIEMVQEARVDQLLHTFTYDTLVEDGRARGVRMVNKGGDAMATAKVTIDCTGDGDVAARAGVAFEKGDKRDGLTMAMGLMFRLGNVNIQPTIDFIRDHPDQFILAEDPYINKTPQEIVSKVNRFEDIPVITGFWDLIKAKQETGEFPMNRKRLLIYITPIPGVVQINTAAVVRRDGTDPRDLTAAENEARATVRQLWRFFRNYVPGFEACYLLDTAPVIGVRETRRIAGLYTITRDDVLNGREFPDAIGRGAYCIDIHEPDGTIRHLHIKDGKSFTIPYRALVPQAIDGLLVAGRCISAEHEALGALRVEVPCMVEGQAAGTAAAMCARSGIEPKNIDLEELRQVLMAQGVIL
jgi:hypothetical protein